MNINFILMEMTHLRYWVPLVIEGNKRGLKSTFYVGASNKYNCPNIDKNKKQLEQIAKECGIELQPINQINNIKPGLIFSSEKTGIDIIQNVNNCKKIVATYQTDFIESYEKYIDHVDHVLMPSEFCAEFYNRKSEKNLYLGIPKYDAELNSDDILEKYNLPASRKCLVIWPKTRDQGSVKMNTVLSSLKKLDYTVMLKTRGKDPFTDKAKKTISQRGDFYFEDNSWHPHTTQELLKVSDFAINFGSTSIEECIMYDVPLINYDVKPAVRNGSKRPYRVTHDYLYEYNYCIQFTDNSDVSQYRAATEYFRSADLSKEFKKARQKHLFDHKGSCKKMLDVLI